MKNRFLTTLTAVSFFFVFQASAQNILDKGEEQVKLFNAQQRLNAQDFRSALNIYKELEKTRANDAYIEYKMGECYLGLMEIQSAIEFFEKGKKHNPKADPEQPLNLGRAYHINSEIDKAMKEFEAYKTTIATNKKKLKESQVEYYLAQCGVAKTLMAKPVDAKVTNMGTSINSEYDDKRPSLTADGKTFIFTSRRPEGQTKVDKEGDNKYFEDIYMSNWDDTKKAWADAEQIPGAINTESHDAACSISPDGKQIFIYKNEVDGESKGGDIYVSKKSSTGKWQTPKKLGVPVNTTYFEDGACLSPDGNTLYFVSENPKGALGMADVWKSTRATKTEWGKPVNLGAPVNTSEDEGGIFLAADGKTLFFSSAGPKSMGMHDMFMSKLEGSKWSEPVNLGYPINTVKEDKSFILSTDGRFAYVTSNRDGGLGDDDIYVVDLSNISIDGKPKTNAPSLSILKGKVLNPDGQGIAAVEVNIYDDAGKKVGNTASNTEGEYFITMQGNRKYEIRISQKGFKDFTLSFDLPAGKDETFTLVKDVLLSAK